MIVTKKHKLVGLVTQLTIISMLTAYIIVGGGFLEMTCLIVGICFNTLMTLICLFALYGFTAIIFGLHRPTDEEVKTLIVKNQWCMKLLAVTVSILFLYTGFIVIGSMLLSYQIADKCVSLFLRHFYKDRLEKLDES